MASRTSQPPRRSLDALFGPPPAAGVASLDQARAIGVGLLDPNPYQPRAHVLDDAARAELDASIRAYGILQPVLVRPVGDRYQLVDGEQRWRAAQRVGLEVVPAVERAVGDEDMELLALLANTQRTDLDPLDEARAYRRIMERRALSLRDMAALAHKSHGHVAQRLRLLDNPEITAAVEDGWLSPTVALSIDRVADPMARAALLDRTRPEGPPTIADAREARTPSREPSVPSATPQGVKYYTPSTTTDAGLTVDPVVPAPLPAPVLPAPRPAAAEDRDAVDTDAPVGPPRHVAVVVPSSQYGTTQYGTTEEEAGWGVERDQPAGRAPALPTERAPVSPATGARTVSLRALGIIQLREGSDDEPRQLDEADPTVVLRILRADLAWLEKIDRKAPR